jgi:hypothetical protein
MMMMTGMRILGWSDGVVQGEPAFLLHRKAKAQFNSLEREREEISSLVHPFFIRRAW